MKASEIETGWQCLCRENQRGGSPHTAPAHLWKECPKTEKSQEWFARKLQVQQKHLTARYWRMLCFIYQKNPGNCLFRAFKLFHEKGKWDFYRKSKNTVMNKCLRQKQEFPYCEIETHLFNTVWLIIGICFISLLVAGGLSESWLLAAAWFRHTGSVWDHTALLCASSGSFRREKRAVMLGPCRGQTQIPPLWNTWSLGGLSGKRRFRHGREGEGTFSMLPLLT